MGGPYDKVKTKHGREMFSLGLSRSAVHISGLGHMFREKEAQCYSGKYCTNVMRYNIFRFGLIFTFGVFQAQNELEFGQRISMPKSLSRTRRLESLASWEERGRLTERIIPASEIVRKKLSKGALVLRGVDEVGSVSV